ncbi:iron complex transport system substrate-binding protein [Actinopolyspora lacussalsi subsp. righensis]|uniref:Iron complex transport system substrate-binding protein n=1 Tax=Actinopolyspora righensis TaxID=995060 RepID=A0A1I6X3K4_9ACTN|nr:iron-siderophore ABC transporter substrate-binding protein [Actinopolyspora righensis]SFT32762.1 iron complex transport system substrate-binding protein [Actinopolyspora righensis]
MRSRLGDVRRLGGLLSVLLLATALSACGQGGSSGESTGEATDNAAFPVTVSTKFGEVTVPEKPERVVALGWSDAETALDLGVQPVGVSDWLDFGGNGVGPWAAGEFTESPEMLGTNEVDYEKVASLEPDLILNTRSDGSGEKHQTLSKIAPTIAPPADTVPYGTSWRQQLDLVSKALGKPDAGQARIAEVERAFSETLSQHPRLQDKTVGVGAYYGSNQYGAYLTGDSRVRFMRELGMTNKPEIDELGSGSFYVDISRERLDVLSADLTVVFAINGSPRQLRQDQLLNRTSAAREDRLVILDDPEVVNAFSSGSASGMEYALQQVAPVFAEHVADS